MATVEYILEKRRCLHFTFLQNFLWRITIKSMKKLFLQKNETRKINKISYSPEI